VSNPPPSSINATLVSPPASGSCGKYPCNDDIAGWEARIHLQPGFNAKHIATVSGHPTSITYDPNGQLVASTMEGSIYRFDAAGGSTIIASGFHLPIGLAYRPGTFDLYVASRSFPADAVPNEGKVTIVHPDGSKDDIVTALPCCYTAQEHQPDSIAFGPDGKVYLSIGARGDHGEVPGQPDVPATLTPLEAGILRFNPDGSNVERYATGLRNPYDLVFDANGNLYATDNSPDFGPPDRLQRIVQGGYYGYPYYAGCGVCAPAPADLNITPPFATFIPHGAVTGITAYLAHQFPVDYFNNLFVTLWSAFPGAQKIVRIQLSPFKISDFALGLADPVDVTVSPEGALVVADWATGHIFKISYAPH
jgi:YD repeat-containing protein